MKPYMVPGTGRYREQKIQKVSLDQEPLDGMAQRFFGKVRKTDGCWYWEAGEDGKGYGVFWDGARTSGAHRFAYRLLVGPIPPGLVLDHLCRNTRCVNPAHLEPVTSVENVRRGVGHSGKRQTQCKRGHPFDESNTYKHPTTRARVCRTCSAERAQRYRAEKRERAA